MAKEPAALNRLSRRQALQLGAGAMLAAGFWPGWVHAADAPAGEDFTFLCVNDLHLFDKGCVPFFERMVRQMNATDPKPDFCLVLGDLGENGTPEQLGLMKDLLKTIDVKTHIVCGNHDFVKLDDRKPFEQLFPDATNYHFEHKGWQFVGLDTTQGQRGSGTTVHADTLVWLKENLPQLDPKKPTAVFTHFPLGFLVPGRPKNADAVLEPFKDFNLQAVFCGHYHAFTERKLWKSVLTTDKCCSFRKANHDGSKEKGYFVCQAKGGQVTRTFVEVKVTE